MVANLSTSYPTLAAIQGLTLTQEERTLLWHRSAQWADHWWGRQSIGHPEALHTRHRMFDALGEILSFDIDMALAEGQRRAYEWCMANR